MPCCPCGYGDRCRGLFSSHTREPPVHAAWGAGWDPIAERIRLMLSVYLQEGLSCAEVLDLGDEHGFAWLDRRALWRRSTLLQNIMLSLFVHLAVVALCFSTPRDADRVSPPWIEVNLVTLGSEGVAAGAEGAGGATGGSGTGASAEEHSPVMELLPSIPPPPTVEGPLEEAPKPAVNPVAARSRPISRPKEPPKTPPLRKEIREVAPSRAAPSPAADPGASGSAAPAQAMGESGEGTAGAAGGAHGKGHHGGHGGGPVDAEFGAANGPRFAHRVLPRYPRLARQLGKEGTVVLRVTIDEGGRPIAVEAVKTAGAGFDEEAIKAVKESLFHPAKREGRPVICRAILPIRFELRGSD